MAELVERRAAEIALAKVVVGRDVEDLRNFGTGGTLFLGKHLVGSGEEAHVTTPFMLDALRPHVIVVTGKRGEGKCLAPGTRVLLASGEEVEIDRLFAQTRQPDPSKDEELVECNLQVVSLDAKLEMKPAKASHVYKRRVNEKLLAIKTKSGRGIVCTKEHPLLSIEDEIMWRRADELRAAAAIGSCMTTLSSSYGQLIKQHLLSWDEIESMEEFEYNGYVYDLTVPGTHNFIANGVVCHNSYTLGIMAEEMKKMEKKVRDRLSTVVIDTQGIFWTMKKPNERQSALLEEWGLPAKGFDVLVHVPEGQAAFFEKAGVPFDSVFAIAPDALSAEEWLDVFAIEPVSMEGILLQRSLKHMEKTGKGSRSINDIITSVQAQKGFEKEKLVLENLLAASEGWGIFGKGRMPSLLEPGKVSIIDVSLTPQNVRSLLVSLMSREIFEQRTIARRREEFGELEKIPLCWLLIDEAHNFVPKKGRSASGAALLKIAREGRQPGITLVLATQRPDMLHEDVLAQTDLIISHRLTSKADIEALRKIMQTYMLFDIAKYMAELPKLKGVALILDDNSERLYTVRMRPRHSWHAGASPAAV